MSKPIDPGTPEARRAWLDSLPVGAVVVDATGCPAERKPDGWWLGNDGEPASEGGLRGWCGMEGFWPATIPAPSTPPLPFACPAGWTAPTPDDVRAKVEATGMTHGELGRAMGGGPGSRGTVTKWLNGSRRMGWPAWRVLCELAKVGEA